MQYPAKLKIGVFFFPTYSHIYSCVCFHIFFSFLFAVNINNKHTVETAMAHESYKLYLHLNAKSKYIYRYSVRRWTFACSDINLNVFRIRFQCMMQCQNAWNEEHGHRFTQLSRESLKWKQSLPWKKNE